MINRDSLCNNILSGYSKEEYLSLLIFGIIGFIASILVELIRHKKNIKSSGGFSFSYWFNDNFYRFVLSIIIIFIGVFHTEDLVGVTVGNKGAIILGFCTDKIIETLISLKLKNVLNVLKPKK